MKKINYEKLASQFKTLKKKTSVYKFLCQKLRYPVGGSQTTKLKKALSKI